MQLKTYNRGPGQVQEGMRKYEKHRNKHHVIKHFNNSILLAGGRARGGETL